MSAVRRALLIAAIAAIAVVPLRAFGVVGGDEPTGLSVSAALGGCGVAGEGIVCEIQVGFGGVEDADYYTASVTRADGGVQDLGQVGSGEGGGSASIFVPYVGAGTYSVTVSAWGTPDGEDEEKPELLERDRAKATEEEYRDSGETSAKPGEEAASEPAQGEAPPAEASLEAPEPTPSEPAPQTLPECQAEAAAPAPAPEDGQEEAQAVPPAPPPAPVTECTTPSADAAGPCCPPAAA